MSLNSFFSLKSTKTLRNFTLDKLEVQTLREHATSIICFYKSKTNNEDEEINKLELEKINVYSQDKLTKKLKKIKVRISSNQCIEKMPLQMFLSCLCNDMPTENDKWQLFQARLLIACHSLYNLNGFEGIINRVMLDYRMLIENDYSSLVIKDISFDSDIKIIVEDLKEIKKSLESNETKRISNLIRLFSDYKNNIKTYKKRNVTRKYGSHETPKITTYLPKYIPEDDDDIINELVQPQVVSETLSYNYHEQIAEEKPVARNFSIELVAPSDVKRSLTRQNILANNAINHMLKREKYLASDVNQLTLYEVSALIKDCLQSDELSIESYYILLSLFSGRSLKQILSKRFLFRNRSTASFKNRMAIFLRPEFPSHRGIGDNILIKKPCVDPFLILPKLFSSKFNKSHYNFLPALEELKERISIKITKINHEHGCKISQARIANHLATYLQQNGADDAEMSMILDWEVEQLASSYYYQVSTKRLLLLHQKYIFYLYNTVNMGYPDGIEFNGNDMETKFSGSDLQVKDFHIIKLFSLLGKKLQEIKNDRCEFHKLYTIYTLLLLNLALGHRAVKNPYESSKIFDCFAGTVFVCDKESRSNLAARIIVLPEIALEQINNYFIHLKSFSKYYANLLLKNEQQINESIEGTQPLFFFINNQEISPVTPSNLKKNLKNILPLPINWHRHYMRTALRNKEVSGQLVDLWMGHLGIGSTNMSKFSALSMSDLHQVAKIINIHMKEDLKIVALKGL